MTPQIGDLGGVSVVAFVLLLSFAVDRLVTGVMFLLSLSQQWRNLCPDPAAVTDPAEKSDAMRAQKAAYLVLAGVTSAVVLWMVGGGVLHRVGFKEGPLDMFLSVLVLLGGAERVSDFTASLSAKRDFVVAEQPVKITGTLTLEEGTVARLRGERTAKTA
jgi:hypothetical protein